MRSSAPRCSRPSGCSRRHFLASTALTGAALLFAPTVRAADGIAAFSFDDLDRLAAARAAAPFEPRPRNLPDALEALSYDALRDIRYRPDKALWRNTGSNFQVQGFHQGFLFDAGVRINIVADNGVTRFAYDPALFDFGGNKLDTGALSGLDFAGFRLHYPLHRPDYFDELAVFLGASYFRVLGRNQHYGLSARGLAIDPAMPRGEEFPAFVEFWLERPQDGADRMTVFALLDSDSAAGAFRFDLYPGTTTEIDVKARLHPRKPIAKLALAPLTSMFLNGENQRRIADDFRPEVHDSDGLLIHRHNGEWVWRPLTNPRDLRISAFSETSPRGFGLMQRDRAFANYQDLEAHYQDRPSLWVEPQGDWGPGRIELLEIPTREEINDNIVAYWVPDRPVAAGRPIDVAYRLYAVKDFPGTAHGGRAIATRIGRAGAHGQQSEDESARRFVIDFAGGELGALGDGQPVEAVVSAAHGTLGTPFAQRNPETGGWRAVFDFVPDGRPADLRCFLKLGDDALTETWTYLVQP